MTHKEHKLGGVVEFALNRAMDDKIWLAEAAIDPEIEQSTETEVFQAVESYITDCLALIPRNEA